YQTARGFRCSLVFLQCLEALTRICPLVPRNGDPASQSPSHGKADDNSGFLPKPPKKRHLRSKNHRAAPLL
ncbi:hypothetical protein JAAARDRAFT_30183, partial [Jaapia argillacea MUCL 33604]